MKKPSTEKQAFFDLLNLAVRKGEKVMSQKKKHKKSADYSEKRTRQHKTEGA